MKQLLLGFAGFILAVGSVTALNSLGQDEKTIEEMVRRIVNTQVIEGHKPKVWSIWEFPSIEGYTNIRVEVIDAGSVCIYISRGWSGNAVAMNVLPKTVLKPGQGCQ